MDSTAICIQQLTHLSSAVIMGRKAPHKAVLLLAIMDLVESGEITSPEIVLTEKLEETFNVEWNKYIGSPLVFKCKIAIPFWHMQNEPFYSLFLNSVEYLSDYSHPYSVKRLMEETYAELDQDFFLLMQDRKPRSEFRNVLVTTYLQGLHSDLQNSVGEGK